MNVFHSIFVSTFFHMLMRLRICSVNHLTNFCICAMQYTVEHAHQELHGSIGVCREFFPGWGKKLPTKNSPPGVGQHRHFAYSFQLADNALETDLHKTANLSTPHRNVPFYGSSHKKSASLTAMLPFHSCFFLHKISLRGLLLSAVTVSLHYVCYFFNLQKLAFVSFF